MYCKIVQVAKHLIVFVQLFPPTAEMGKTCGTYGDKKIAWKVLLGILRDKEHLQDPQRRNKEKRESKTVRRDKVKNISQ
jgi:hypothetical protein